MMDWPSILTTDNENGVPTHPFRRTESGTIGYGHQNPQAFAAEVSSYNQIELGENYDPEIDGCTPEQVQHLWVTELGEWLIECEEKTPGAFPVTLCGELG